MREWIDSFKWNWSHASWVDKAYFWFMLVLLPALGVALVVFMVR